MGRHQLWQFVALVPARAHRPLGLPSPSSTPPQNVTAATVPPCRGVQIVNRPDTASTRAIVRVVAEQSRELLGLGPVAELSVPAEGGGVTWQSDNAAGISMVRCRTPPLR
jgi:hypothetical protein